MRHICFSFSYLILLVSSLSGSSAPSRAAKGQPETNRLQTLQQVHPRLVATAADFAALKTRIAADPELRRAHDEIRRQAESVLKESPSKYEIPDGLRLLATSRRVMNRMYLLGYMHRMEPDPKYAERAWAELDAAAHFPNWNPRHFLDTAEMTHAFAIGYDWFYDIWTPEQRSTLTNAIIQMGLSQAMPLYRAQKAWTVNHFNWNQVCNGGIGIGALAIGDLEPGLTAEILEDSLKSLPLAMSEFAPDGAWKEGPGYWNYATMYNVAYLAALKSALGTDFGLSKLKGFSEAGMFPIYMESPIGRTFNYADSSDREGHAAQLFWFSHEFQRPAYAAFAEETGHAGPWDMLWYPGHTDPDALKRLPLDKHFRNAEVATFRGAWLDKDAAFVGFKCGDNKAGHSHLDLGSFIYDALGVRWVTELGHDDYNLPSYFGKLRWTYYRLRAEGHNTLVLNPGNGPDQDPSAKVAIQRFASNRAKAFAIADLTPAYASAGTKVHRGVALLNRTNLLVQDELQLANESDVWSFIHTPAKVTLASDGSATLERDGKQLHARILSPPGATFTVLDPKPFPTSPQPEKQADNPGIHKLAIHLKTKGNVWLAVLLSPSIESAREVSPKLIPLERW